MDIENKLRDICSGLPLNPLPPKKTHRDDNVPHAPVRNHGLSASEKKLAVCNALRYFPCELHKELVNEFKYELAKYGHIYMYRFIPDIKLRAYPIEMYPCRVKSAAAIMHMIMNNLDHEVAQFPHELVTYGGNGQVFGNWAQFWIVMHYLSTMDDDQTLSLYSGHPHGLFPSNHEAPRLVITNGMVIPNYSTKMDYDRLFGLGVTQYGQMTAGSFCYIGPQGIVHGTTLTILNAGRKYLSLDDLSGCVYVTSGLGGMSGAQAKASVISGCVGVIAEVDPAALHKRHQQGWLSTWSDDLDECIELTRDAVKNKTPISIGYLGNIVDLWEHLVKIYEATGEMIAQLASDQTSCHNPFGGGYFPAGMSFEEGKALLDNDPNSFKKEVQKTLCRHVKALNTLSNAGMYFWDYGNAFLLEAHRAGADVTKPTLDSNIEFKYPSYVQHIMGDIFSLGFGPFRWVCASGKIEDLEETDKIASDIMKTLAEATNDLAESQQYKDNYKWIREAGAHEMVVGSKARILYSNQVGRVKIALEFNKAVREGKLSGPVIISRDHHDVSGTDSPYRETSNIYDGSQYCADMAVQNCIGDAFRGATWVALHNGGGVGWGEVINGGFGLVLDGSDEAGKRAKMMLQWDVNNGVARRAWSGNNNAFHTIKEAMSRNNKLLVTLPSKVSNEIVE